MISAKNSKHLGREKTSWFHWTREEKVLTIQYKSYLVYASYKNKMLSYRRETALQGTLVLAESGRLELGDNILLIL